ncbi:MAG TPA: hypothetical protein VG323_19755 [Thermoanaerobaculia bacterium]|nr:hypothetical protein [Thermoanaerobaculia bacterium]
MIACIGCAVVAAAAAANEAWFDAHFLPSFWTTRGEMLETLFEVRITAAAIGIIVVLVISRPLAHAIARDPLYLLTTSIALVMACGVTEAFLRTRHIRAAEEIEPHWEPRRHLDARLGWLFDPSRVGYDPHLGKRFEYAFDGNGYRVPAPGESGDFDEPAIVFIGESMMFGEKLDWEETVPAETSDRLGIACANISVSGFATDQQYLRLAAELPRFRHPVAVVTLFAPVIFDRNLDDDRPHLGPGLRWHPAAKQWRLTMLARRLIGYRSAAAIEDGITTTRQALAATVQLARARGAVPLIVVPNFGDEEPRMRELRRRILDDAHLPYVYVRLNPDDRIENDGHPDGDGMRMMAEAIAGALRPALGRPFSEDNGDP